MHTIYLYAAAATLVLLFGSISIIREGHVGVAVLFGKYHRILRPGFNLRIPFVESVYRRLSLQHRSVELEFCAITSDQANVMFKALIIYAVQSEAEETIKRAAFKFIDEASFMQALIRSVEGSIRSFVATKTQSEILALRKEIIDEVNSHIEHELNDWGFHLINLQINDISFDEAILRSMAQVVATHNMKAAAENEAQAQYIAKTRVADAEAQARRVVAEADKDADEMRADAMAHACRTMTENGLDPSFMLYAMWLDSMKTVVSQSHGNILSFDGSMEGFDKTFRQMTMLSRGSNGASHAHR